MAPRKPQVVMKKWHEFAKDYQAEHKLESYTDALKQAPAAWKKYKESFATENPNYDAKAVAAWERQEREKKIAAGLIAPPKRKYVAAASKKGESKGKEKEERGSSLKTSNKKETFELDSDDDDYDVVIRTVTTKKRKRSEGGGGGSSSSSSVSSPPPKNKRKRSAPVKKVPTTYEEDPPPLTKKSNGRPIPLPASAIKRKSTHQVMTQNVEEGGVKVQNVGAGEIGMAFVQPGGVLKAKKGVKKEKISAPSPTSLAQEMEEDFLPEYREEEEEGEEGEIGGGGSGFQYADELM